jgi:hypothetical protein
MMKKISCLVALLVLCLLAAVPSALKAQETGDSACPLFLQPAAATSSVEAPFLIPVALQVAPLAAAASTSCGSCSFRGCAGATVGHACVTFAGAAGTCFNTGKLCGDHAGYCGCY